MDKKALIPVGYRNIIAIGLVLFGLYLTSLYSYLFFHSVAELFSISVAWGVFMLTWNARRHLDNNFLLFIGTSFLFVGGFDLLHTLSYKGMGVFEGHDANLPTQLWIATRYVQSISFFIAPFFINRKFRANLVFSGFALVAIFLGLSIFSWNIFPDCYIEGFGLTPFKKISEYMISLILVSSIGLLLMKRHEFDANVLKLLVLSLVLGIGSELAFTFYISVYGFSNLMGHFLKILSLYLIYRSIIVTGIMRPHDLLFRNLKLHESELRRERDKAQQYLDIAGTVFVVIGSDQAVTLINKKGCEILGYREDEIIGRNWFDLFIPERIRNDVKTGFKKLMAGDVETLAYFENPVLMKNGGERIFAWRNTVIRDETGVITGILSSGEDITDRKMLDEAILRAKKDWETTFDTMPDLVMLVDKECRIMRVNRATADKLGMDPAKIIGRKCYEFMHGDGKQLSSCPHTRMLADGKEHIEEVVEKSLGGHYLITVSPIFNADGHIEGSVHVARDITELKQTEERLIESRQFSRQIMESTPNIIFIFDIADNYLVYANHQLGQVLGYTQEDIREIGGTRYQQLLHPEDMDKVNIHLKQIASVGDGDIVSVEVRVKHADGEWRWLQIRSIVFKRADDGSARQVLGSAENITGRKKIEDELEKYRKELEEIVRERTAELVLSNEELEQEIAGREKAYALLKENERKFRKLSQEFNILLDAIPDSIMLLSHELEVLWANRGASVILGRQQEEIKGKSCYELWRKNITPCEDCPAVISFTAGQPARAQHMANGKFWEVRAFPLKDDDGNINNVIVFTSDITEKITLQAEAMRAGHLASLGELAAGMAHEINNPINGIINYAQILADRSRAGTQEKDMAKQIIEEGERIAGIVKSLLSFARDRKEDKTPVNVRQILSDSLALTGAQILKDGIKLTVDFPYDLPEIIAHPQQIQQVFLNVINNARDALNQKYPGPDKDKNLRIYAEKVLVDQQEYVRIVFYDTGQGIPADIIDKVMNPFFTTKPAGKGTGLGLSISHGIISEHEGRIRVESVEGEFASITIDLPVKVYD